MASSINQFFSKTLPEFYSDNISENSYIQKTIDWAPSIIMAVGIHMAPYIAGGLIVLTFCLHLQNPEHITSRLIKNIFTAAALAIGANSIVPLAKALIFNRAAIISFIAASVLGLSACYFDEIKETYEFNFLKSFFSSTDILENCKAEPSYKKLKIALSRLPVEITKAFHGLIDGLTKP